VERQIAAFVVQAMEQHQRAGAITEAMNEIDAILSRNPMEKGESRDHDNRVLIVDPLTVFFRVLEDKAVVWITEARYHPSPT
jgi:hypothetical protein